MSRSNLHRPLLSPAAACTGCLSLASVCWASRSERPVCFRNTSSSVGRESAISRTPSPAPSSDLRMAGSDCSPSSTYNLSPPSAASVSRMKDRLPSNS